jgi:glycine/serine hydroxymethyltransferase
MAEDDMREIGDVICATLSPGYDDSRRAELSDRTRALIERYPIYENLAAAV